MAEHVARLFHQCVVSKAKHADQGLVPFPRWPNGYVLAALILLESDGAYAQLMEVIQRSRHGERRWFHGSGLLPTPKARRSTMVGDIVIVPSGRAYRLRSDRFERVVEADARISLPASVQYAEVS